MATPFEDTPKWFNANHYLDQKAVQMQAADPAGNWTREKVISDFAAHGIDNPYDHYKAYGDTENLTPNALFNNTEYLAAKAAMMGSTWTVEMVAKAIHDAGLTLMEHYIQYGGKYENLSPSSDFNQDKYFDAKLQANIAAEPDKGWTLDMVKADFAAAGISALEHYLTYGAMEGLDKYDYSENGAPIPHPGNTNIQLTKGADLATPDATVAELKTSDRDDTIHALAGSSTTSTLNAGDVIDGGAGLDTLVVDMQATFGGFTKGGSVKNVENIVLKNANIVSFNADGVVGVDQYTVDGSEKGGVTIKNVDSAETSYSLKMDKGDFAAQIKDSALSGKADDVSVSLNGVGSDTSTVKVTVKGNTISGVEGLTLNSVKGTSNYVNIAEGHESLTVSGEGNTTLTVAKAGLKSFDASDATGKVVAVLSEAGSNLKTINGGAGDDTITVKGLATGAVVDGGDGKDTLILGKLDTITLTNAITGVETFEVTAGAANTDITTFNMTNIDGLETFKIVESGNVSGAFVLKGAANSYSALNLEVSNKSTNVGSFTYDGTGDLNIIHSGAAGASDTSIDSIVAGGVTVLNISNTAESGLFTIDSLDVAKVETINIDAAGSDVKIDGSANKITALTNIQITGQHAVTVELDHGSALGLDAINASSLQGDLNVKLAGLTVGTEKITINGAPLDDNTITLTGGKDVVDFIGGSGLNKIDGGSGDDTITVKGDGAFTITGGAGADIITLSDGKDTLMYAATDSAGVVAEGSDHIKGFETGSDVILFGDKVIGVTADATVDFVNLGANASATMGKVNEVVWAGTYATYDASDVDDVVDVLGSMSISGAVSNANASANNALISIDDGTNTYLWQYSGTDANAAITDADIHLIGVLEGVHGVTAFGKGDVVVDV